MMLTLRSQLGEFTRQIGQQITSSGDTAEDILRKTTLILLSMMTSVAGIIWSGMYLLLGQQQVALVPLIYSLIIGLCIVLCLITRRTKAFLSIQLTMIFVLPCAVHLALGGIEVSGLVILWSFLAPLGAALFHSRWHASLWFVAFAIAVSVAVVVEPMLQGHAAALSDGTQRGLLAMNTIGVMAIVLVSANFFLGEIEHEHSRSEKLLLNILPASVAHRLKMGEESVVDRIPYATIMFADLVGFTEMSARMEPRQVIDYLNRVFSAFDILDEKHNLDKIKTIGDAYMVVGGLRGDTSHVQAVAHLALDILAMMDTINTDSGDTLQIRIGIHVGPVVAGVIGTQRIAYDVWGDAVNIASRMESQGIPGEIQVSDHTFKLLQDQFEFSARGELNIKGKGAMTAYLLRDEIHELNVIRLPGVPL
jgi:guanylate cyclase